MIVNRTRILPREGIKHFATKTIVGETADKLYTELAKEKELQVFTWYERVFNGVFTERGPRQFRGDVVIYFISWPSILTVKELPYFLMSHEVKVLKKVNIEIDGDKKRQGHASALEKAKNKFRDYCLMKYFKCQVKRLPTRERDVEWIESQLKQFYFDKVVKND